MRELDKLYTKSPMELFLVLKSQQKMQYSLKNFQFCHFQNLLGEPKGS